jgi:dTDP-4-amino-4,6-dideoxygalactose transaminase
MSVTVDTMRHIPFANLQREREALGDELRHSLDNVVSSGWFILGRELESFEKAFASYCGTKFAVGVASGTDALHLSLLACDVGAGDEVITVANTFIATALAISWTGAKAVFVDVDPQTQLIDPRHIESRISPQTRIILPVHLFGRLADMSTILEIAGRHKVRVLEDACQAHGAASALGHAGSIGDLAAFSFYPTKNLGAYGDAGMVTTNDPTLAERLRALRNYGQTERYHHAIRGFNSRLDEIQAAVLNLKLAYLNGRNLRRIRVAQRFSHEITNPLVTLPPAAPAGEHVFHLYVVQTPHRDALRGWLSRCGVDTQIHYPIPIHQQKAFLDETREVVLPVTERLSGEIVSLPIYPELTNEEIDWIIRSVNDFRPT